MRDERNHGSAGKSHSPSTKRRRGRRLKGSNHSTNTHTPNFVSTEASSNPFVLRLRRNQRETRRYRHKSASSIEGNRKNLASNLFKYESSNKYLLSGKIKSDNHEQAYSVQCKAESTNLIAGNKDLKRIYHKSPESNGCHLECKNRYANETTIINNAPLKIDEKVIDNFEDAKVSDILKSVIAREYKAIPARPSNPLRYKTELCRAHEEGGFCRFGMFCTFAHGQEELRAVPRHHKYKTELCRSYHSVGYCQYGARCHFIHDPEDGPTLKQTPVTILLPQHDSGSSAKNLLESISIKENVNDDDALMTFNDLDDLENKPKAFFKKEFDFAASLPELSLSTFEKSPSFMDFLLQSQHDEIKIKDSKSNGVKSDQYFEFLDTLSENPDALFSSEWSSSRLPKSPFDESWWKDIPSLWKDTPYLPKLNWLEPDDSASSKVSTLRSLFPSLREKDQIGNPPSLSSAVSGELLIDFTEKSLDTKL